jgi:hypothetical protein
MLLADGTTFHRINHPRRIVLPQFLVVLNRSTDTYCNDVETATQGAGVPGERSARRL